MIEHSAKNVSGSLLLAASPRTGSLATEAARLHEGEKYGRAASPRIVLLADTSSPLQQELSRGLREDEVAVQDQCDLSPMPTSDWPESDLFLSLSTGEDGVLEHHQRVSTTAAECGRAWIAAALLRSRFLLVGPLLTAEITPCYACILACASRSLHSFKSSNEETALPEPVKFAFAAAMISSAVAEGLETLQCTQARSVEPVTLLYDLHELTSTSLLVGRVPGCATCWPVSIPYALNSGRRITLPALFEECSRNKTVGRRADSMILPSQLTRNPQASRTRAYPNSLILPLPPWPSLYRDRSVRPKGELGLREISSLLFLTFGRWNGANSKQQPDRVLPSGGNLGSPGAFLIVRNVVGLEPGAYFYLEASHELARIESAAMGNAEGILSGLQLGSESDLPDAFLVMIGSYGRISVKYRAFGYRLVHFDSGLFVAHLRTVAHSLLLTVHEMSSWPEKMLAQRLAIDTEDTPITAAIGFNACESLKARPTSAPAEERSSETYIATARPPQLGGAAELVKCIQTTSTRDLPSDWTTVRSSTRFSPLADGEASSLFAHSHADVWNRLLMRRSVRDFEDKSIASSTMTAILRNVRNLSHLRARDPLVKVLATLRSGSASHPMWRTFDLSSEGRPSIYGTTEHRGSLESLFVHPAPARAPLLFWLCGDVRREPWLYRRMLLEVGQQAYDLMQEASCFCLEGMFVGGIWPKEASSGLGLRFCDESPLLAFACGLPQRNSRGE